MIIEKCETNDDEILQECSVGVPVSRLLNGFDPVHKIAPLTYLLVSEATRTFELQVYLCMYSSALIYFLFPKLYT